MHVAGWLRKWPKWAIGSTSAARPGAWHVRKSPDNVNIRWYWDLSGKNGMEFSVRKISDQPPPGEIALWWMPRHLSNEKSTLVQVMAWCHQAASHYLSRCWLRYTSSFGVTMPQWVNELKEMLSIKSGMVNDDQQSNLRIILFVYKQHTCGWIKHKHTR